MTKPVLNLSTIQQALEGWDVDIDDNFTAIDNFIEVNPLPVKEYNNATAQPAATSYDRCLSFKEVSASDWYLTFSDGTSWRTIPKEAAAQVDSTATTVAGLVTDFNSLLAKLRATHVITP